MQVYRARNPKKSPLWQIPNRHYDEFEAAYPEAYEAKADLEDLAQYILHNPSSVEKMTLESPTDIVIYRSRLNAKINRNFEVFTATDFLAAITHISRTRRTERPLLRLVQQQDARRPPPGPAVGVGSAPPGPLTAAPR